MAIRQERNAVIERLNYPLYRAHEIPATTGTGIYVLYLTDPDALPGLDVDASGRLYLGMTESSLEARNHFAHENSSFSSPRRSLGALLKKQLALRAIARGAGRTKRDFSNYRFQEEGEQQLTAWMFEHLAYGFAVVEREVGKIEKDLISSSSRR